MTIRVLVNGAKGRMGQETVNAIQQDKAFTLVATADKTDNLTTLIQQTEPQVVIDFTRPAVAYTNTLAIIEAGARPVIGTTGFMSEEITTLQKRCAELQRGGIIAPNFSLAAVLMMKSAKEIARYLPEVEIIELHHTGKQDAPSGTALKTAEMLAEVRQTSTDNTCHETVPHARGACYQDIHIHSVRLPGFVAHQEIIFGGEQESLTLRHDCIHRAAFMPGVKLACQKVMALNTLVYGLENLL